MRKRDDDLHEFTVEGAGAFPFDMLRYDSCWPKSEQHDSHKLDHFSRERRQVTLLTNSPHAPTVGRWGSFNWRVVPPAEDVAYNQ